MKTKRKLILMLIIVLSLSTQAQVAINTDGTDADASAMLDVKSENKGMLIPRLLASQRSQIGSPATGLMVYQTDGVEGFYFYNGTTWLCLNAGTNPTPDAIEDADNDTKVEVERNTDEDKIRLTTADTTRMTIDELGRVGIGTTNLDNNLTIYSYTNYSGLTLQTSDNSFNQGISFRNSGGSYTWFIHRRENGNGNDADLIFSNGVASGLSYLVDRVTIKHGGAVGIGTSDPDASALLEMESTSKGFLPPRVANVSAVSNPVEGLMVFDESTNCMRYYNGSVWSECMGRTFTCGDILIDSRDGKSYATVQIGNQ